MLLDQNNITGPAAVIMMEIQGTEQHAMAAVAGSQLRLELIAWPVAAQKGCGEPVAST